MISKVKRLLSLLLVLAMLVSFAAPVTVSATSETAAAPQEIALEVGESTKLKTNSQFQRTTWSSSDPSIATVSGSGTVTGVAPGNAVITAETRSFFGFGKTQITTYNIIVFEPEKEKMTIVVGETLELSVNSDGGSVTWSSSDEQIATVDENGVVSGVSAGDVTVTAAIKKTTRTRWFFWWRTTTNTEYVTFEIAVMPAEDIEDYYSVIFETNGGSAVETQVVEEGLTAVEPEEPIREGYSFSGWFSDEELTSTYDFETPVTADITLYAGWTELTDEERRTEYYVTFMRNDETGEPLQTVIVNSGSTVGKPADPVRDGYQFTGWYTDTHGTEAFDFTAPVVSDVVLFAGWSNPDGEEGVYSTSSGGGTIYSITEILVEGRDVGVTINTNSTAILRVEFLDEKTMELLAETAVQTPAYCEQEQLLLYVDYDLPESFLARATLYDLNGEELATYTSIKYTANYQIFEAKTADDYEAEGERVVRFSTQTNLTNFGVLADGVQEIPFNGVNNIVTMSMVEDDPDSDTLQWTNVYTIENPDETILNVQPGTVLLLTNPDGTTYLFKVGSVTVQENGSVVILPAEEVYMADFYKALKVDMNILIDENDDPETISEEPALLNASPYAEIKRF